MIAVLAAALAAAVAANVSLVTLAADGLTPKLEIAASAPVQLTASNENVPAVTKLAA
ncbi:hypothetical protein AEGHOMDF_3090 [Methylobacterium soli]|nr:hypothetical protein AEGHOMDF_3090 [Methylobacterium soli]